VTSNNPYLDFKKAKFTKKPRKKNNYGESVTNSIISKKPAKPMIKQPSKPTRFQRALYGSKLSWKQKEEMKKKKEIMKEE